MAAEMVTQTLTQRELEICLRFGIVPDVTVERLSWPPEVPLRTGSITLVVGPSGAGKSTLLRSLAAQHLDAVQLDRMPFPDDVPVIDAVAPAGVLAEATGLLTASALGEPKLWLRRIHQLSDGEQFRARLARAISLARRKPRRPLLCDEFTAGLHRRAARAVAFNLRKLASREGLVVVAATAHEDLEEDLQPDTLVRLSPSGHVAIEARVPKRRRPSFADPLRIEEGSLADYHAFADLHYRGASSLGCVDRVFLLRNEASAETLGVVVYGYPPLELALRNEATEGRYIKNASKLNAEIRILRRLVVHPDVRGCGLGHWLVRHTLPLVGTPHVECLAAMGMVNPVFERAGMRCVGLCATPDGMDALAARVRAEGTDPFSADFVGDVCRKPRLRRLVAGAVADWYRGMTAGGKQRALRQEPATLARTFRQLLGSRPVYYLWSRENAIAETTPTKAEAERGAA